MGAKTKIQWSDATWGPTRGCSMAKGSEAGGCLNCYAARYAVRGLQRDSAGNPFAIMRDSGPRWTGVVELAEDMLMRPLQWKKPRKIFVNSMSDLFHEALPDEAIDRVFAVMALCPHHTFQILTKRPERMLKYLSMEAAHRIAELAMLFRFTKDFDSDYEFDARDADLERWPLRNVWLGCSVENQETADARIPLLLQTPAAVRFVSYEPALGPVDFREFTLAGFEPTGKFRTHMGKRQMEFIGQRLLHQIIVGGESGPGARPFDIQWARNTIQQCKATGTAVFMKQFGSFPCQGGDNGTLRTRMPFRDKKGGDIEEFPEWARVREFPC